MTIPRDSLVRALSRFLKHERSWVLFEHGTVVVAPDSAVRDLGGYARMKLEADENRRPGSAAGDASVIRVDEGPGWVVASHDPDIFTFVPESDIDEGSADIAIGMAGRAAHEADARGLEVVHVHRAAEARAS
ncbi:MAG: hypothetical protein RLO52_01175 [Sandaracinaceae bacterium]|nr:hypothetical protein [Myxococcales bacterium]